ncbi:MAG: tRNA epoxyqueuosine(34) reductase QueG [Rhodothalassiaceae bacterium]
MEPAQHLADWIRREARAQGFDAVGFTTPEAVAAAGPRLDRYIALGRHGEMGWMAETRERRRDPRGLWPELRSVIMLGMNYGPGLDPLALLAERTRGAISVYARGRDYHDVMKSRLKTLGRALASRTGADLKVFVDTAPVMEKPLAAAAGLGWQGKHSNLVSREYGSWLFLGAVFTTLDLEPDPPHADRCGSCHACLDICPTAAFPAPYQLDARRCISYLTIEHKGHIADEFLDPIGNRIYGCDDCLAVCPWNSFARTASQAALHARVELTAPRLADLATLDDAAFREVFAGSPIKRIGRDRFLRNVLIAIGNSADPSLLPAAIAQLDDPSPLVRAMAVRAVRRLAPPEDFATMRRRHSGDERDPHVAGEWAKGSDDAE